MSDSEEHKVSILNILGLILLVFFLASSVILWFLKYSLLPSPLTEKATDESKNITTEQNSSSKVEVIPSPHK